MEKIWQQPNGAAGEESQPLCHLNSYLYVLSPNPLVGEKWNPFFNRPSVKTEVIVLVESNVLPLEIFNEDWKYKTFIYTLSIVDTSSHNSDAFMLYYLVPNERGVEPQICC